MQEDVPTTLYLDRLQIDAPGSLVNGARVSTQADANELWRRVHGAPYPGRADRPRADQPEAERSYATPGTIEHGEYQQLTHEILRCRDLDRARKIGRRLAELRGGTATGPRYPDARPDWRERWAATTGRYRGVTLPRSVPNALCGECKEYHERVYRWRYEWLCARHWAGRAERKARR
jgi:hypothetical protein